MISGTFDTRRSSSRISNPFRPGSITSRITRSGRRSRTASSASSPEWAPNTAKPCSSRYMRTARTRCGSSSTTRMQRGEVFEMLMPLDAINLCLSAWNEQSHAAAAPCRRYIAAVKPCDFARQHKVQIELRFSPRSVDVGAGLANHDRRPARGGRVLGWSNAYLDRLTRGMFCRTAHERAHDPAQARSIDLDEHRFPPGDTDIDTRRGGLELRDGVQGELDQVRFTQLQTCLAQTESLDVEDRVDPLCHVVRLLGDARRQLPGVLGGVRRRGLFEACGLGAKGRHR